MTPDEAADVADGFGTEYDPPEVLEAIQTLVQYARDGRRGCGAYHPDYGFTCVLPPHVGPHYDTSGGHWDETGQLQDIQRLLAELARLHRELRQHARNALNAGPGQVVHHLDGDPTNNNLDNLRLVDPRENVRSQR